MNNDRSILPSISSIDSKETMQSKETIGEYKCVNDQQSRLFSETQFYVHRDLCMLVCDYLSHDGVVINPDFCCYMMSPNSILKVAFLHPAFIQSYWHKIDHDELIFRVKTRIDDPNPGCYRISYRSRGLHKLDQIFMIIEGISGTRHNFQCGLNTFISIMSINQIESHEFKAIHVSDDDGSMSILGYLKTNFNNNSVIGFAQGCLFSVPQQNKSHFFLINVDTMNIDDGQDTKPHHKFFLNHSVDPKEIVCIVRDDWLFMAWNTTYKTLNNTNRNVNSDIVKIRAYRLTVYGWHTKNSELFPNPTWETEIKQIRSNLGHVIDINRLVQMEYEPFSKTLWFCFSLLNEHHHCWCYLRTDARLNPYKTPSHEPIFV